MIISKIIGVVLFLVLLVSFVAAEEEYLEDYEWGYEDDENLDPEYVAYLEQDEAEHDEYVQQKELESEIIGDVEDLEIEAENSQGFNWTIFLIVVGGVIVLFFIIILLLPKKNMPLRPQRPPQQPPPFKQ